MRTVTWDDELAERLEGDKHIQLSVEIADPARLIERVRFDYARSTGCIS